MLGSLEERSLGGRLKGSSKYGGSWLERREEDEAVVVVVAARSGCEEKEWLLAMSTGKLTRS